MQAFYLVYAVDDILLVEVAELYFSDIFCLDFVDAKARHEVGDNILFLFGVADNAYRLVDVKKYLSKTQEKMELVLLLLKVVGKLAADAGYSEGYPRFENIYYTELHRMRVDEHIKVALEAVLKGCHLKELSHKLIGVDSTAEVECKLKSAEVYLVTEIYYLLKLAFLYEVGNLVKNHFYRRRVGNLYNVYAIVFLVVVVA